MDEADYINRTINSIEENPRTEEYILFAVLLLFIIPTIIIDILVIWSLKMRTEMRTKRNIFILNWCIGDLAAQLTTLTIIFVPKTFLITLQFWCMLSALENSFKIITFIFLIVFLIDFLYERLSAKALKYFVIFAWCIIFLYCVSEILACLFGEKAFHDYVIVFCNFLLNIVFLLKCFVYEVYTLRKKAMTNEDKLRFILVAIFLIFHLIQFVFFYVFAGHFIQYVGFVLQYFEMIFVVCTLIRFDINFKHCILSILGCGENTDFIITYSNVTEA